VRLDSVEEKELRERFDELRREGGKRREEPESRQFEQRRELERLRFESGGRERSGCGMLKAIETGSRRRKLRTCIVV
jgi:hypothetical protein